MSTKKSEDSSAAPASDKTKPRPNAKRGGEDRERDIGHALRSIYQKTVDESVPPEMLDLLGKLG